jgi:phosphoglycerate dehydrogenase-like enzyme
MHVLVDLPLHEPTLSRLHANADLQIEIAPEGSGKREFPRALLERADILLCEQPPANFEACQNLRWIQISSAGYTQLFGLDLPGRNIRATNARGCFDVPIAEWNVAMMINLARNLRQMIRNQESRTWDRGAQFQTEIRGKTVGLWGYGGIGRETARLSRAMGLRVHVLSRSGVHPDHNVYVVPGTGDPEASFPVRVFTHEQKSEFLRGLDFLILAMPLTPETEGVIGEAELEILGPNAFLLNPARGPLVREQALIDALRNGTIAGAALDTHYAYPLPPGHPLWAFPNVILTPHISGSSLSPYFLERVWDIFSCNLDRWRSGMPLLNELTPEQLRF